MQCIWIYTVLLTCDCLTELISWVSSHARVINHCCSPFSVWDGAHWQFWDPSGRISLLPLFPITYIIYTYFQLYILAYTECMSILLYLWSIALLPVIHPWVTDHALLMQLHTSGRYNLLGCIPVHTLCGGVCQHNPQSPDNHDSSLIV